MNHYWIFLLGMFTGAAVMIFAIGLCQTAREDYFYGPDQDYPTTKNEKQTSEYLLNGEKI